MNVVIIGAGGFGREVLDVVRASDEHASHAGQRRNFIGFIDDAPVAALLDRINAPHLGGMDALRDYADASFVVAVGDPTVRERLVQAALEAGLEPAPPLIHPSATLGGDVVLGRGTVVCAGVRITTHIRIGDHVHLNLNTTVGHDATLADFVTVNPLAAISGDVTLERGSTVGTTACVNQGLTVGALATVGSGAAVVRDVPGGVIVVGVPARPLK